MWEGKEMVFINELSEIRAAGRSVFEKYMLPQHTRSSVYQWWLQELTELRSVQERIERVALEHFSASEFFTAWQEFHAKVEAFWPHVIIPELGNYGSLELLEELLTPSITDDTERTVAMEVLARMTFTVETTDSTRLAPALAQIRRIPGVRLARRR